MPRSCTRVLFLSAVLAVSGCGSEGDPTEQSHTRRPREKVDLPDPGTAPPPAEAEVEPSKPKTTPLNKLAQERKEKTLADKKKRAAERAAYLAKERKQKRDAFVLGKVAQARDLLSSGDPAVRVKGLRLLKGVKDERILQVMMLVLDDPDPRLTAENQFMLGQWGDEVVTNALFKAASVGSVERRVSAIKALGMCHYRHVSETRLVGFFVDPAAPTRIRAAAAESVGQLLMWSAAERLSDGLKDKDAAVRLGAYKGLSHLLDVQLTYQPDAKPERRDQQAEAMRAYWTHPKQQAAILKNISERRAAMDRMRGVKP